MRFKKGLGLLEGSARYSVFLFCCSLVSGFGDIVVTTLDDAGPGSLREAITNALDGDVISFDEQLSGGVIHITEAYPRIRQDIIIDGSSLTLAVTIDAGGQSRIFSNATAQSIVIRGLHLINGFETSGGAISNSGTLLCESCVFQGNIARRWGGAIYSSGSLTLSNCTLTENRASVLGAAIHLNETEATLRHCTVVRNGVSGREDQFAGNSRVASLTAFRPFKFERSCGYFLFNSIVSQNFNDLRPDRLEGRDIDESDILNPLQEGNLIGVDPFLAPLRNYGGSLPCMIPILTSPAIDSGLDLGVGLDQRGASRLVGTSPDIGAVEVGGLPEFDVSPLENPVVTLTEDRDEYFEDGENLSLREAVARASAGAEITFAANLAGQTIGLERGRLTFLRDLSVFGNGLEEPIVVSGLQQNRIFFIEAGVNVSIRDLIIENGFVDLDLSEPFQLFSESGGGIFNAGNLLLARCVLRGNQAPGNGGGVFSRFGGSCEIDECSFDRNIAGRNGGGACLNAEGAVRRSTFTRNMTEDQTFTSSNGGGLFFNGRGLTELEPRISNCTFFANSAGRGGGFVAFGVNVAHCTVVGNSARVSSGGAVVSSTIKHSIITNNDAPDTPDISLNSDGQSVNNLIEEDAKLGQLQNNGGVTETFELLAGSPAIDPQDGEIPALVERDQRGYFRTIGATADIGAFEFSSSPFPRLDRPVVTSGIDEFKQVSEVDLENLTLREAITFSLPETVITFSEALSNSAIAFTNGEIEIHHSLTIDGQSPSGFQRLDAELSSRHFRVPLGRELKLKNLRLENGFVRSPDSDPFEIFDISDINRRELAGGSIFSLGDLAIDNCEFIACQSGVSGGAIGINGSLDIRDSVFEDCHAGVSGEVFGGVSGGAIWIASRRENLVIRGSRFEGNFCEGERTSQGGAIWFSYQDSQSFEVEEVDPVDIDTCFFVGNVADEGGAIFGTGSNFLEIKRTNFVDNRGSSTLLIEEYRNRDNTPTLTFENCLWDGNLGRSSFSTYQPIDFGSRNSVFRHCTFNDSPRLRLIPFTEEEEFLTRSQTAVFLNCLITHPRLVSSDEGNPNNAGNYEGPETRLSPLGSYGGRWPTLVPLPGSQGLDIGVNEVSAFDQRGFSRGDEVLPDAGAVERRLDGGDPDSFDALEVTVSGDPLAWDGDLNNLSLRQAMSLIRPDGLITIGSDLTGQTIDLERGTLRVVGEFTISGSALRFDSGAVPVMEILHGGNLTLRGALLAGASEPNNISGRLSLENCEVRSNAVFPMRTLFQVDGEIKAVDCHFEDNSGYSGVVKIFGVGSGEFERCSFFRNRGVLGGALCNQSFVTMTIRSCTFSQNEGEVGGAIHSRRPVSIEQSTIVSNSAEFRGGGVSIVGSGHVIVNSVISLNTSPDDPQVTTPDAFENENFLGGNPQLLPAGFFGGTTMTMPPLQISPVIDAGLASSLTEDQRGFERVVGAAIDYGAAEFQGREFEFSLAFDLDSDGDGLSNALEQMLRRDPTVAEASSPYDLRVLNDGTISLGYDSSFDDLVRFEVTRSDDLVNFETMLIDNTNGPLITDDGFLRVRDEREEKRAFYRIEVFRR